MFEGEYNKMIQAIRKSTRLVIVMLILCGLLFPLTVTAVGQIIFPHQANGSLITKHGKVVGSELIGQQWESRKYFHGRISAVNYNMNNQEVNSNGGPASGGSNFGNSNPKLKQRVKEMIQQEGKARSVDAVTASASGLDPDITVKNAEQQAQRIAKARDIDVSKVNHVIVENKKSLPMADDYVNVLKMNIALDKLK